MWNKSQNQAVSSNDPFAKVGDADARLNSVYPVAGVYPVLQVDAMKMITSRKGDDVFIAEFDVLESLCPDRPAGTRMSWAVNFRHDAAAGNVKSFIAAVMNSDASEVDAESARYACSPENPCSGRLVRLEATETITKSGSPFTVCSFRPIPDPQQAQAEALRKKAGF
jgi:hypothetical protein